MDTSLWIWLGFSAFILLLLAFDLGVLHRRPRAISVREALWLSLGYFLLAAAFNAGLFWFSGPQAGYEFMTGYLLEKSLSVDNIFVFVLIFTHFAVDPRYQYRVLFWGIIGALVMRGLLIVTGASLIASFHWIIFVFGGFLLVTGFRMLRAVDQVPDIEASPLVRFARKRLRVTEDYHGEKFFVRRDGALWATPLFLVLIVVEISDLVFAVDSIPAIFAITHDPFIVYTSNVFAILGLRALYFALAGVIHRFHHLKYGLSLVLMLVGAKMIVNAAFGDKVVPVEAALLGTVMLIGGSIAYSLWRNRGTVPAPAAPRGWVPGSPPRRPDADGAEEAAPAPRG